MAPVEDADRSALAKHLDEEIPTILSKYDELWEVPDPEETPYKTKYQARALLQKAVKETEKLLAKVPNDPDFDKGREMVARLLSYLGKNFYFCEEVPEAERHFVRSLERYLRSPLRLEPNVFVCVQDVLNQLGMLWCNRHGHAKGMNYLRRAQIMFKNRPQAVRDQCEQQARNNYTLTMFYLAQAYGALKKPGLSARFCAETLSQQLEHNAPGLRSKEVLEKDPFDCKDWVRNCCSLSDFFANECMFWTAEYLLHSALVMCERCEELCGLRPEGLDELTAECARDMGHLYSTRLKFARTCTEHPQICEAVWRGEKKGKPADDDEVDPEVDEAGAGSRLSFLCAGDPENKPPEGGTADIIWDEIFPEVVHLEDEEAVDNRLAEENELTATEAQRLAPSDEVDVCRGGGWLELVLGERIRLPVHFKSIHDMAERRVRRANATFIRLRGDVFAAYEAAVKDAVGVEGSSTAEDSRDEGSEQKHAMPSCAATAFEPVREIFKLGNHFFLKSLSHFLLDGWVTEHVKILQELSQMYRCLQGWEKNPKRSAAMMHRRVRMLAPLLDVLNPKAYVAFFRQLAYEVGEIFQELYELKAHGKLPGQHRGVDDEGDFGSDDEDENPRTANVRRAARRNELARKAVKYFTMFIESYHQDGKVPDKIEDDHARAYLMARLNRARLRTKTRGLGIDDQVEGHRLALREYEWMLNYAARHPQVITRQDIAMEKELHFCTEMVNMLPTKLSRMAARRR